MKHLLKLRYLSWVVALFMILNALTMMIMGIYIGTKGYRLLYKSIVGGEWLKPGIYIVESTDLLLIALVFLILGISIIRIFTYNEQSNVQLPGWMDIRDFKGLKLLLWEAILLALMVATSAAVLSDIENLSWKFLVLPGTILMLAVSLKLMRHKE